ncbi:MAG: T9SS type A sorting domain-containing protein [Salinivirgaceae bacterium]|nr:T9SS type A sorting domain-containing protein [Salinivirgaceae bacterium]
MNKLLLFFSLLLIYSSGFSQNSSGNCFYIDYETWNAGTQPPVFFDCGNDTKFEVGAELTMEAWIRVYNAGWNQKILGKANMPFNNGYVLAIEVGKNYSEIFNPVQNELKGGAVPVDSAWVHFCTTFKAGEKMATYVNGVKTAELTPTNNPIGVNTNASFIIGHAPWADHSYQYFGHIDEVRIWNVAHTEEEINSLMFKSLKGDEAGLVASYNFNETDGTVLHDNSVNELNGSLNETADYYSWKSSTAPVGDETMYEMYDIDGIWFGKNDSQYNYLISDKGLNLLGKLSKKDFDYAILGHNNENGISTDDLANLPANSQRVARTWYCNASSNVRADMVFQLTNASGTGEALNSVNDASLYTLLFRTNPEDDFTPLYGGNIKSGEAIIFNNVKLQNGYYSMALSDEVVVNPNGINEAFIDQISIYPNPAKSIINIGIEEKSEIIIYDLSGKIVYQRIHNEINNQVNTSNLKPSYYVVKVITKNKQYLSKLIIN